MVLDCADQMAEGGAFEFYTELNPRALINRLEQLRPGQLAFQVRHVGDTDWHVTLTRVSVEEHLTSVGAAMRRNPTFNCLAEDARALLEEAATEYDTRKNETICAENEERGTLGILVDGSLAVVVGAGARERLLFHLFPCDTFGEGEFFDGGLSMGRTVVLSKTARYATIPYDVVRRIARENSEFLSALATITAQRNRTLASALASQVSQPILARVATALLPYAAPERGLHPALPPLPNMTQSQVAAFAGTVKEVAARAIAELERLEALRRERGHIRYLDRTRLLEAIER